MKIQVLYNSGGPQGKFEIDHSLSKRVKVFDHHSGLNKLKNPWTTGISVSLAWSYIEQALNLYDSETRQERFKPGARLIE